MPANASRTTSGRYSGWRLLLEGLTGHRGWSRACARATPRSRYRVVIVGGGGHGLATAFYLATVYGIRDVVVLEKGPLGLGNVGRNTTIIRSNTIVAQLSVILARLAGGLLLLTPSTTARHFREWLGEQVR